MDKEKVKAVQAKAIETYTHVDLSLNNDSDKATWPAKIKGYAESDKVYLIAVSEDGERICDVDLDGIVTLHGGKTAAEVIKVIALILAYFTTRQVDIVVL